MEKSNNLNSENTNDSYEDRIKKAKEILRDPNGQINLSIESALGFLDHDELRYLLWTMTDIVKFTAFPESTDREEALLGAIRINSWISEEVDRRMEKQGFDVSMEQ